MRVRQDLALRVIEAIQAAQTVGVLPEFEIPTVVIEKPRTTPAKRPCKWLAWPEWRQ